MRLWNELIQWLRPPRREKSIEIVVDGNVPHVEFRPGVIQISNTRYPDIPATTGTVGLYRAFDQFDANLPKSKLDAAKLEELRKQAADEKKGPEVTPAVVDPEADAIDKLYSSSVNSSSVVDSLERMFD